MSLIAEELDPFEARIAAGASGLLRAFNRAGVLSAADVHVGQRVAAVWASPAEEADMGGMGFGSLVGWVPLDEPDVVDPDLVNRIY